jgi:hypothetical protein
MNEDITYLDKIPASARGKVERFIQDIVARIENNLESIAITGSVLTVDFDPERSDINSVIVLKKMDLNALDLLIDLGKKHKRDRFRSPLIMTEDYIHKSLDVFPIEFLDIKLLHATVYGKEIFSTLGLEKASLRLQCERDLKARLVNLRQSYVSSMGVKSILAKLILDSFPGFFPIFRAMLEVIQETPSLKKDHVLNDIEKNFSVNMEVFRKIHLARHEKKPKMDSNLIHTLFNDVYATTEKLSEAIDAIHL